MRVAPDVLTALQSASTQGSYLMLAPDLDRDLLLRANKVLAAVGGKWTRAAGAHVFDGSAADAIEPVLLTGMVTAGSRTPDSNEED